MRSLRGLLLLGLGTIVAGAASPVRAAAPELPPLVSPATTERHPGKLVFVQLVTPDLAAAKQFYGALFGWSFQDAPSRGGTFTEAAIDGTTVAGIVQRPIPAGRQPAWLTLFSTDDVDKADAAAAANGGKVLFQPHAVANLGRETVIADPQGAVFALLASGSGDPPDVLAEPGQWIWSSLITTDPATDATFYKTLLGDDVFELPGEQNVGHLILASGNYARASINPVPASWTNAHPRWLNYVRVDDAAAMASKAASLGGRIVLAPRIDRHGGKIAVVADPQGALFGLMEWSDDAPSGDAK